MSGFTKTLLKNLHPILAFLFFSFFFSLPGRDSKGDDIKIKSESQSFFPLVYLPLIGVPSLFFLFYMACRLPLGVVKSK